MLASKPTQGYVSISTVNLDFIQQGGGLGGLLESDKIRVQAELYAPLDGMNEKGLAVSVNMIQDSASVNQDRMKRLSIYLLVLVMLFQTMACPAAAENIGYSDVDAGAWYAEAVEYCREKDLRRKCLRDLLPGRAQVKW